MKSVTGTWFARSLEQLANAVFRHPKLIVLPQLFLTAVCVFYTVKHLRFDTSRDNLVGANKKYHRNFLRFKQEFPEQDDLVVVVESESAEKNRQFVERLGAKLEAETNLFKDVFYKGDLKMMGNKALLFVSDQSSPTFAAGDLKDLPSFARKLKQPSDAVSAWLYSQLSLPTQQALLNYPVSGAEPAPLLTLLTNDLNRIIGGESIFEAQRFAGVSLRPETQQLLAQRLEGDKRVHLNRLLIEDAYPLEIARSDLEELLRTLQTYRPFIAQFTKATNLVSLFDLVNTQFRTAKHEENDETASLIKALPALERIVSEADGSLRRPGTPPSPGIAALFNAGEEAEAESYITFNHGKMFLVTAHAPNDTSNHSPPVLWDLLKNAVLENVFHQHVMSGDLNSDAVDRLRQLVDETKGEVPGLNIGVTGEPVLENDEMAQSQKDTTVASIVSLILCSLIFVYGYNETGRPIKATLCLLVGIAYTLGFATLVVGHLNILTITFVPILIGLAIDFGVHLIARFEEELRRGRSGQEAMTKAIVFTGQGIFTGAFTTAGAFLAMGLTDFKGIQEMGIICGGGLLVCLVPMMTLLPVLLLRGRQNSIDQHEGDPFAKRARIESLWLDRPVIVTVVTLVLCGLAASQFRKVEFDYDLLNMQSRNLPAVVFEKKLIYSGGKSVLFGAVIADSLEEAKTIEEKVKSLPAVAGVESMTRFLTEDPTRKLQLIGEIKREIAPIRFEEYDTRPVRVNELSATLYYLQGYCGLAADEAGKDDPDIALQLLSLRDAINDFRKQMLGDPATAAEKLAAFQQALFSDVRETFQTLATQDARDRLRVGDLPAALRNRFVGVTGKYLIQVYPKEDIWQRKNQKEFVHELRQALTPGDVETPAGPTLFKGLVGKLKRLMGARDVDDSNQIVKPIITGTPVQLYEYTSLLVNSYIEAACYSLAAIILLVFIHFRTLSSVLLALVPVAVGSVWLGGIMGGFGIPLNPANIMTLPLVIGIGVTNGIQILNRYAEEKTPSILAKSTGKAVLVSGLTAIAGFGSLILGKHQGIQSLGLVMSIGIATCMVAGLTFLPALLNLLMRRGQTIKQPSADNAPSTLGREEPR